MIIVEGPDNAGKSTLIKQLIGLDPLLRILFRDRFKPEREETIGTSYLNALLPKDGDWVAHGHSIADRLFASECIYGKLFRNGCRMSPAEHISILSVLQSYDAIIVHCDPPDEALLKTWKEREQLYDRDPLLIAKTYREELGTIFKGRPIIKYDWTIDGEMRRQSIIQEHAQHSTFSLRGYYERR